MVKSELIARLAARNLNIPLCDVPAIVDAILDEVAEALCRGHRVELRGFGSFAVKTRVARCGRNPLTGAPVSVAEKRIPSFKTGKDLRERLNEPET
jgi:integration host factor subunit beta